MCRGCLFSEGTGSEVEWWHYLRWFDVAGVVVMSWREVRWIGISSMR